MSLRTALVVLRREGRATIGYPFVPEPVPEDFRGKPEVDKELCMGCGACAQVCPPEAIKIEDDLERGVRVWRIFYGRCIFCGRCEEACPLMAIRQTEEFELASARREDLEVVLETPLARCSVCGRPLDVTDREVKQLLQILQLSKTAPTSIYESLLKGVVCSECRRKLSAESIAKGFRGSVVLMGGGSA